MVHLSSILGPLIVTYPGFGGGGGRERRGGGDSSNLFPTYSPAASPRVVKKVPHPPASQAIEWTDGRVVYAAGSPYENVTHNGKTYEIAQVINSHGRMREGSEFFLGGGGVGGGAVWNHCYHLMYFIRINALGDQSTPPFFPRD